MDARSASIAARRPGAYQRLNVGKLVLAGYDSGRTQQNLSLSDHAVRCVWQNPATVEAIAIYGNARGMRKLDREERYLDIGI